MAAARRQHFFARRKRACRHRQWRKSSHGGEFVSLETASLSTQSRATQSDGDEFSQPHPHFYYIPILLHTIVGSTNMTRSQRCTKWEEKTQPHHVKCGSEGSTTCPMTSRHPGITSSKRATRLLQRDSGPYSSHVKKNTSSFKCLRHSCEQSSILFVLGPLAPLFQDIGNPFHRPQTPPVEKRIYCPAAWQKTIDLCRGEEKGLGSTRNTS